MSIFSFPFPITVVSLSGWTGGTRETVIKLHPEAKNRHRPKMQVEIVKKYLLFVFFMMKIIKSGLRQLIHPPLMGGTKGG